VDAALRAALLVASALASGYQLGREIAGTAPDRGPKNGRLANPFGKATIFIGCSGILASLRRPAALIGTYIC
jgi:hypothetical protein